MYRQEQYSEDSDTHTYSALTSPSVRSRDAPPSYEDCEGRLLVVDEETEQVLDGLIPLDCDVEMLNVLHFQHQKAAPLSTPVGAFEETLGGKEGIPISAVQAVAHGGNPIKGSHLRTYSNGLVRCVSAVLHIPRDVTLGLAESFRVAPQLYGDESVRAAPVITGVSTGIAAAGRSLGTGLYDGLTGFVLQPVQGAKKSGMLGCAKGVGKGIGGLVFKPCAGACGVPGYALEGVHSEIRGLVNRHRPKSGRKWK